MCALKNLTSTEELRCNKFETRRMYGTWKSVLSFVDELKAINFVIAFFSVCHCLTLNLGHCNS